VAGGWTRARSLAKVALVVAAWAVTVVGLAVELDVGSLPGGDGTATSLMVFSPALFLPLLWLFMIAGAYGSNCLGGRRGMVWSGALVTCVACSVLVLSGWPMRTRLEMSRSALDRTAVYAAGGENVARGWIGLYQIEQVRVQADGSIDFILADGYLHACNLTYRHVVDYTLSNPDYYELVSGDWWVWCPM
jgi:hypothetical protein